MRSIASIAALALALSVVAPAGAQTPQTIASAYGGTVPAACTGAHVDLNQLGQCRCTQQRPRVKINGQWAINARSTCGDAIEKRNIAQLVDLRVTVAPAPVRGGDPMTVIISIQNRSHDHLPVVFEDSGPYLVRDLRMHDAAGRDVMHDGLCGQGFGTTPSNYMVVIAPGGVAEWRLPWQAATRVDDAHCNVSQRPLPPGTYEISVPLGLGQMSGALARGTFLVH